jgi:hypothetical protein
MRGSPGASDCALPRARAFAIAVALTLLGCPYAQPLRVPERKVPPRVLVVRLEQVALRTSAWVSLHLWLAASARASIAIDQPGLDAAARGYAEVLADDARDEALAQTTHALALCDDEPCARAAVAGSPFASAYVAALPGFLARHWEVRAEIARAGIDVARAALGEEVEALVARLSEDLAVDWPAEPPAIDVVGSAPELGRDALVPAALAARGRCFTKERQETERMHDARVIDCVLAYAALGLESRSAMAAALGRELAARGKSSEVARAWTALVVHATSVAVSALSPRHVAVLRGSAAASMPRAMEWLAREWTSRMRGEPAADFAKRYAAALDEP